MKKILVINQFSKLNTGYGIYGNNLLQRLNKEYEVAELACDATQSFVDQYDIPWKVYANNPESEQERQIFNSNKENDFGKWKFHEVCLDFQPDICIMFRDIWMDRFIINSPYKKFYNVIYMPAIDAEGQNKEWIDQYAKCESILTYQDWSGEQLSKETNGRVEYSGSAPFIPDNKPTDREELRRKLGIDGFVIGTVMRNQRRKRFPELFRAFSELSYRCDLYSCRKDGVKLYCHTGYPDNNSWDIPGLLLKYNIQNKVYFTYTCQKCRQSYPSLYKGINVFCNTCKIKSSTLSNAKIGPSVQEMSLMYNLFDLYVQFVQCEALGMPQLEAAAVGCPVIATNYSAMIDIIPKINGQLIDCETYQELESDRFMAAPSEKHFVELGSEYYQLSQTDMQEVRDKVLSSYNENFTWEKTYSSWKNAIENDTEEKPAWNSTGNVIQIPPFNERLEELSNKDFVRYCIDNLIQDESLRGGYLETKTISELNENLRINSTNNEDIGKEKVYEDFSNLRNYINQCEIARCQKL